MEDQREGGLLRWQWSLYPEGHRNRRNLAVHAVMVPIFDAGTCALLASPFLGAILAAAGVAAMIVSYFVQGSGHQLEHMKLVPFRGPFDLIARVFTEQWLTFPRYVLSGGFAEAWRKAG